MSVLFFRYILAACPRLSRRQLDASQLVKDGYKTARYYFQKQDLFGLVEPWRAILDGLEFNTEPMKAFRDGTWHSNKTLIFGSTSEEIYIQPYWPWPMNKQLFQVRNQT